MTLEFEGFKFYGTSIPAYDQHGDRFLAYTYKELNKKDYRYFVISVDDAKKSGNEREFIKCRLTL